LPGREVGEAPPGVEQGQRQVRLARARVGVDGITIAQVGRDRGKRTHLVAGAVHDRARHAVGQFIALAKHRKVERDQAVLAGTLEIRRQEAIGPTPRQPLERVVRDERHAARRHQRGHVGRIHLIRWTERGEAVSHHRRALAGQRALGIEDRPRQLRTRQ
jgi:hypothetical protein